MAMRLMFITVALLGCATVARLQGGAVDVQFSETDYEQHEEAGTVDLTVTLIGQSMNENIVTVQVHAFTRQQFVSQGITCSNPPDFASEVADEGEENELVSNTTTCSGVPSTGSGTKILCSFDIAQDGSLERDEYLVFVLRLKNRNGYTVNVGRDCTIGRISAHETLEILNDMYRLVITNSDRLIEVTEGSSVAFHFEKRFQSELDITVKYEISNDPPVSSDQLLSGPSQSEDFFMNNEVIIPAGVGSIDITLEIVDDDLVERTEYLSINFFSRVAELNIGGGLRIANNMFDVAILDNDVLRGGFNTVGGLITITEGQDVDVCVEILEPDLIDVSRGTALDLNVVDGSAMSGTHFFSIGDSSINLEEGSGCVRIYASDNVYAEGDTMLQVYLTDTLLSRFSEPADAERYRQLNIFEPATVTVVIKDDEGPPNQPNIIGISSIPNTGGKLTVTWETENEGGAHPFLCHFGTITERSKDLEKDFSFDLCSMDSPTSKQYNFSTFDPSKTYIVVVCSKNSIGQNCSDRVVIYKPSPLSGPVLPPAPALPPGIIAIIVIPVLIVLVCCILLILLLIFCLCCKGTFWKSYDPEKRERKYGSKMPPAHGHDACYLSQGSIVDEAESNVYS